jgi:hypothetical protein
LAGADISSRARNSHLPPATLNTESWSLANRVTKWAGSQEIAFGPAEKLEDEGFAFWKARDSGHPRVLADARNYMDRLARYGAEQHGAGVQIDVNLDGRSIKFLRFSPGQPKPLQVVEHATFEDLAAKGILPSLPKHRYGQ